MCRAALGLAEQAGGSTSWSTRPPAARGCASAREQA